MRRWEKRPGISAMDRLEQQNSELSEIIFNTLPFEFHGIPLQIDQTSPRKVCTRVVGNLEKYGPDENTLEHL